MQTIRSAWIVWLFSLQIYKNEKNHFYHSDCRRFDGMVDFRGKSLYTQTITAAFGL